MGICLFAFVISTIALASQKSNLQNELEDCQAALGGQTPATEPSGGETTEPTETETEAVIRKFYYENQEALSSPINNSVLYSPKLLKSFYSQVVVGKKENQQKQRENRFH